MKAGQVRMMESVVVIFIFFVLIVFGLVFYAQLQRSSFEERQTEFSGDRAVSLSLYAMFLPELRCTKGDNIVVKDCVDVLKLEVASVRMKEHQDYYFDTFGFSTIAVSEVYPEEHSWTLYDQKKEVNGKATFARKARTPIPVALFNPIEGRYSFGVMTIDVYS